MVPAAELKIFQKERIRQILWLSLVVAALYLPTLSFEFVNYDDPINIEQNPFFNPLTPANVGRLWGNTHLDLYIPLTYSVWALLAVVGYRGVHTLPGTSETYLSLNPTAFHVTNLLLFLGSVWLVFFILLRLLGSLLEKEGIARERIAWGAFAGAMLFALHPVQVESVAWVTSMKGTLSGIFCLAAFYCYLKNTAPVSAPTPLAPSNRFGRVGLLLFGLAILSKPTAVILPLWLFTVDYFIFKKPFLPTIKRLSGWIAIASLGGIVANHFYRGPVFANLNYGERAAISLDTLSFYLGKLFFPTNLSIEYGHLPQEVIKSPLIFLTALIPLGVAFLLFLHFRKTGKAYGVVGALLFAINLIPVLGFKSHEMQSVTNACDRYLLLSLLGPSLVCGYFYSRFASRRGVTWAFLAVAIVFFSMSLAQTKIWQNSFTLYNHALKLQPQSPRCLKNLAAAYDEKGDYESASVFYRRAIELNPRAEDLNRLGVVHLYRHRPTEATEAFRQAFLRDPQDPRFAYNLSVALSLQGNFAESHQSYAHAARLAQEQGLPPFPLPRQLASPPSKNE